MQLIEHLAGHTTDFEEATRIMIAIRDYLALTLDVNSEEATKLMVIAIQDACEKIEANIDRCIKQFETNNIRTMIICLN
jgi:hypothetical protein